MSAIGRHQFAASLIIIAVALQIVPLPADWIEDGYANGLYAALERAMVPIANATPFTIGDVLLVALAGGAVAGWAIGWRRSTGSRAGRLATIALRTLAGIAVIVIWFDLAWALNYRRASIIARVAYDPGRVRPATVAAFAGHIADELNATAPLAHAEHPTEAQLEATIASAFAPVVQRLGDRFAVTVSRPKHTIFDGWFGAAGIGGTWDPFAYETILNAEFLPFERPFALAHEWGHVAGFGDEGDANLIAALTTLRSPDAFVRYSGLFWAFGFLPDDDRRAVRLSPLVIADLDAARARFLRAYNPRLFALQWTVYDGYLRANRVAHGVQSYSLFVAVLVGTPLDRAGLPVRR